MFINVNKPLQLTISALGLFFFAIQLVPVERTNPPVETEAQPLPATKEVLKRACYDCHSNETKWPWYSYVAPASWLVVDDVHQARENLNFSTWNLYDSEEQLDLIEKSWEKAVDYILRAAELECPHTLRQIAFLLMREKDMKALCDKLIKRAASFDELVCLTYLNKKPGEV